MMYLVRVNYTRNDYVRGKPEEASCQFVGLFEAETPEAAEAAAVTQTLTKLRNLPHQPFMSATAVPIGDVLELTSCEER